VGSEMCIRDSYYTKGGALDVGKASTQAVVSASIAILIANFVLTQIMLL
jgi:phospholipid/cholesterol/gamma-HCH transport system permease protein